MAHHNIRVRGENAMLKGARSMNYHWADRNGWMYLCRCFPGFRIAGGIKWASTGHRNRTRSEYTRWLNQGAK